MYNKIYNIFSSYVVGLHAYFLHQYFIQVSKKPVCSEEQYLFFPSSDVTKKGQVSRFHLLIFKKQAQSVLLEKHSGNV